MPRSWKRKTNRGVPLSILERASSEVKNQGKSVRSVAKLYGICHVTLHRFCRERSKLAEQGSRELPRVGYHSGKKVFADEQEEMLTDYLMRAADAYYGLCPREVKELAYQLAMKYGCKYPKSWDESSKARTDWFSAFMKRNTALSIRSAEATSLTRATSFNKHNIGIFIRRSDKVKHKISLSRNSLHKKQDKSTHINQQQCKIFKKTPRNKKQKKKNIKPEDTDSSDADENVCIVCMEHFKNSKPKEAWVQCMTCHLWAHEACTPGMPYVCHHCDSDDDDI